MRFSFFAAFSASCSTAGPAKSASPNANGFAEFSRRASAASARTSTPRSPPPAASFCRPIRRPMHSRPKKPSPPAGPNGNETVGRPASSAALRSPRRGRGPSYYGISISAGASLARSIGPPSRPISGAVSNPGSRRSRSRGEASGGPGPPKTAPSSSWISAESRRPAAELLLPALGRQGRCSSSWISITFAPSCYRMR